MDTTLVKVIFRGNSSPQDGTGEIKLADGPNGEPRKLTLGGAEDDALVTSDELHMLTSRFQIEVSEEQPTLTPEEVEAQSPNVQIVGDSEVTLPNPDLDAQMTPAEEEAHRAQEAQQQQESDQQPSTPVDPTPASATPPVSAPDQAPVQAPTPSTTPAQSATPASPEPAQTPGSGEGGGSSPSPAVPQDPASPTPTPSQ